MLVFVLDTNRRPLDPCHSARARELLRKGKAAVFRRYPFTIILKNRTLEKSTVHPHRIKIDPGSKVTGFAVINETSHRVVFGAEVEHRGEHIRATMTDRASLRRSRRWRKTRYRPARFLNRNPEKCIVCGKNARHGHKTCRLHAQERPEMQSEPRRLPPSLESRVANTITWTKRLMRYVPVSAISMELVRFDLQRMANPEIHGVEYQHGTLFGYEVKEYLLEKFNHLCAYCEGFSKDPVLNVDHVVPRNPKSGPTGTDRISNLAIACRTCNEEKGNLQLEEWLGRLHKSSHKLDQIRAKRLPQVLNLLKKPLKDASVVNSTRWAIYYRLQALGIPVETGSGGQTKFNRTRFGLAKEHWIDAACVGHSTPERLWIGNETVLRIAATGHGKRQRCGTDRFGFPIRHALRQKKFWGFQTGDIVRASVPTGKFAGTHTGRVAIRFRPRFRLDGFDVHPQYLTLVHRADGYRYAHASPGLRRLRRGSFRFS